MASQRAQQVDHALDLHAIVAAAGAPSRASRSPAPLQRLGQLLASSARSTSPMPPAAVASRRASAIASRSLSCSPRSSSIVDAHVAHGLADVLGPDLLLGARHPVVVLDRDQLRFQRLDLDVQLGRLAIDLGEALLHACARAASTPSSVVGSVDSCRSTPSRSIAMRSSSLRLLGGQDRVDDRADLARELLPGADQLIHHLDRLGPLRRQVREDADAAAPVHHVLDAVEQLLALDQIALHVAHVASPASSSAPLPARP